MHALDGRVAIVTGAGRGLGRSHARELAAQGAAVVVNDLGSGTDGEGSDGGEAAERVAAEIRAAGGSAVASAHDVTDWKQAEQLVGTAVDTFGDLHVLVNNAGILRDRFIVNMTEAEWDDVVSVDLKGTFLPLRHAAAYWRDGAARDGRNGAARDGRNGAARDGRNGTARDGRVAASVVNVSSTSGLQGNPGQANYGAAKAGVAALTVIAAQELARYGVRVNAIAPAARTRMTEGTPGLDEMVRPPEDARFDEWDPDNVAPVVAWLATADCPANGRVLYVFGGTIQPMGGWGRRPGVDRDGRWSVEELAEAIPPLLD